MPYEGATSGLGIGPIVSIIMGAYNAETTVRAAVDSILAQGFTDWEFIICDDASTDATLEICRTYADEYPGRFQILANERNMKLPVTLNRCLAVARGKYIARMDADDISIPERLSKQVAVLDTNADIDLVGTGMQRFDGSELADVLIAPREPNRHTPYKTTPFFHATILARREVYERIGGYTEAARTARSEDIELWFKFFKLELVGRNIPEPLYLVRENLAAIKRRSLKVRWNSFRTTVIGYRSLGYPIYWYYRPVLQLCKGFVPFKVQLWYRHWQKARHENTSA